MDNCIFCKIVKGEIPSWKVYEDEHTYAFFDVNPKNEYHTLVIPKKHYVNIFDIPEDEAVFIMRTIKKITGLFNEKLGIDNVQVMNNSGEYAQQEVFHLHFHILPRFKDDGQNCKWPAARRDFTGQFEEMLGKLK